MARIDKIFDEYSVPYYTSGSPNTSEGWISIRCCHCSDTSNHGGFNLSNGAYHCWKCGGHPTASTLMQILGVDYNTVQKLLKKHQVRGRRQKDDTPRVIPNVIKWPTNCSRKLLPAHIRYLEERGLNAKKIAKEYRVRGTGKTSRLEGIDYSKRIIFPIYDNNKRVVSWQSRDVTGKATPKYKALAKQYEKVPHQHVFFRNPDYDGTTALITEGVFDALNLGRRAIALFGIGVTRQQLRAIANEYVRVFIFFDPEHRAQEEAKKLVRELNFRGVRTKNINIHDYSKVSDPAELDQTTVQNILSEIL